MKWVNSQFLWYKMYNARFRTSGHVDRCEVGESVAACRSDQRSKIYGCGFNGKHIMPARGKRQCNGANVCPKIDYAKTAAKVGGAIIEQWHGPKANGFLPGCAELSINSFGWNCKPDCFSIDIVGDEVILYGHGETIACPA